MLLGILYCASSPKLRAQKFFELCQMDLNPSFYQHDKELEECVPKLFQITYDLMLRLYQQHRRDTDPEPQEDWFMDDRELQKIYEEKQLEMVDEVFIQVQELDNEAFIARMSKDQMKYLEAYNLRLMVYEKVKSGESRF